jgi:aspartyl-tRNA synthetase
MVPNGALLGSGSARINRAILTRQPMSDLAPTKVG